MLSYTNNTSEQIRAMPLFQSDPLRDPRWAEFVQRVPGSSAFHTVGWLKALHDSYGYEPVIFTSSPPGESLSNGIPFCRIRSWLTGARLVSLPFSDYCEPLGEDEEQLRVLMCSLPQLIKIEKARYVEIRPLACSGDVQAPFRKAGTYYHHVLDLQADNDELFHRFHQSSVQRRIRRGTHAELEYQEGRSDWHIEQFYRLFIRTRRRLHLPPSPIEWFRNIASCMGDQMTIGLGLYQGEAIAAVLILHHRDTVTYKYGCSDERYHKLGSVPWILWKTILEAKQQGAKEFDFGRSDLESVGLVIFKRRWATRQSVLNYWRLGEYANRELRPQWPADSTAKSVLAKLPDCVMLMVGRLLYRHIG